MLNFIRKIRKSLIESGSARKYIIYAIGEIALVVIGILIALQVNNWNENRKARINELIYLENLYLEFQENLLRAQSDLDYSIFQTRNASLLLKAIEGDTAISNKEILAIAVINCGWAHKVDFLDDVWEELNNAGTSKILSNSQLKEALTRFYKGADNLNYRNITEWNSYNLGFRRLIGKNNILKGSLMVRLMEAYQDTLVIKDDIPEATLIIQSLQEIDGVGPYLADIKFTRTLTNNDFYQLIEYINTIIEILKDEIE